MQLQLIVLKEKNAGITSYAGLAKFPIKNWTRGGPDGYWVDLPGLGFTEKQTEYGKGAMHVTLQKSKIA